MSIRKGDYMKVIDLAIVVLIADAVLLLTFAMRWMMGAL
jgi:hypothetical protein